MPRIRNNGLYTGHSGEASHDICDSNNQHIRHMDTYMYPYGFRSATHMSYPERSWVQLAYLYLHDSLPETAGNTVNCSVFSIFQDILRLVKLHFFLHTTLENSYQCIGVSTNCSLVFSLLSAVFITFGEASPQHVCLTRILVI